MLMNASLGKSGQASVWCDLFRQITHAWLVNNDSVEDDEVIVVLASVDGVVFMAFDGG